MFKFIRTTLVRKCVTLSSGNWTQHSFWVPISVDDWKQLHSSTQSVPVTSKLQLSRFGVSIQLNMTPPCSRPLPQPRFVFLIFSPWLCFRLVWLSSYVDVPSWTRSPVKGRVCIFAWWSGPSPVPVDWWGKRAVWSSSRLWVSAAIITAPGLWTRGGVIKSSPFTLKLTKLSPEAEVIVLMPRFAASSFSSWLHWEEERFPYHLLCPCVRITPQLCPRCFSCLSYGSRGAGCISWRCRASL